MKKLMIKLHEAWLEMLMAGFMSNSANKETLIDFSDILFRHFTWVENEIANKKENYNYDRTPVPIKVTNLHIILKDIIKRLEEIESMLGDDDLGFRIKSDIIYFKSNLNSMEDEEVKAFDMQRELPDISLTKEATDALTLFLFEETYKEYELILIYNYLKAHSSDYYMNRIFQILIDESFFHLKRFGDLSAKMGILAVPRVVMKELYQVDDVIQFLKDGIDEEIIAKEECRNLSDAVSKDSSELAQFFDFINNQENYHISLMRDALKHYISQNK